jgi:hypothetical protein
MGFPSRLITSQIEFDALGFPNVTLEVNAELLFAENNFLLNGLIKKRIGQWQGVEIFPGVSSAIVLYSKKRQKNVAGENDGMAGLNRR